MFALLALLYLSYNVKLCIGLKMVKHRPSKKKVEQKRPQMKFVKHLFGLCAHLDKYTLLEIVIVSSLSATESLKSNWIVETNRLSEKKDSIQRFRTQTLKNRRDKYSPDAHIGKLKANQIKESECNRTLYLCSCGCCLNEHECSVHSVAARRREFGKNTNCSDFLIKSNE